jgi:hypothetical protein
MTSNEFEEEVKNFSPEKDDLKTKVDDLIGKGAGMVHIMYFITEHKNCRLIDAVKIINDCPNRMKRYGYKIEI